MSRPLSPAYGLDGKISPGDGNGRRDESVSLFGKQTDDVVSTSVAADLVQRRENLEESAHLWFGASETESTSYVIQWIELMGSKDRAVTTQVLLRKRG